MDRAFVECIEAKGKCIERLCCYDSVLGIREIELQFTDGAILVWRITTNVGATGELMSPTPEGLAIVGRYPLV